MKQYTYSSLLEDFIKNEHEQGLFEKKINGVYIWTYLRFFVYTLVKDHVIGGHITFASPIVKGVKKRSIKVVLEECIKRNVFFMRRSDVLIISHGRKIADGGDYFKDWNTGYLNEKLDLSHIILDRCNTNDFYYPCRMGNVFEYHLNTFGKYRFIKVKKMVVKAIELYELFLKPIEDSFGFNFSNAEKNNILGYADYRVGANELMQSYVRFVLKRVKPKVIILGMVTDAIMQVFCEIAHDMGITCIYLQEGVMFEAVSCYYYKPSTVAKAFFPDYVFCFGDYEKDTLKYLPVDENHMIPVGSPDLEEFAGRQYYFANSCVKIMVISSAKPYLAIIAGELSENLDSDKYQVLYKIHPMELKNYDREIFPLVKKYKKLKIILETQKKAYRYYYDMTWIVGSGSLALFEATKFRKKIAYIDPEGTDNSPLIEKNAAVRVRNVDELINIIENDSFVPNFSYEFYYDNAIDNINREIHRIVEAENEKQ